MGVNQAEQEKFKKHLTQFWALKGNTQFRTPQLKHQDIPFLKLYRSVCKRGGYQAVKNRNHWTNIAKQLDLTQCQQALRSSYQKYLFAYERKYFFGKQDVQNEYPEFVGVKLRRSNKSSSAKLINQTRYKHQQEESNLLNFQQDIDRLYYQQDRNKLIFFKKKSQISPSDIRRIMLGLQSGLIQQSTYSLNMLMIYSANYQNAFLLDHYPSLVELINGFIQHLLTLIKKDNLGHWERIKTILLILRNLALTPANQTVILKSPLVGTLQTIFVEDRDEESSQLILQVFSVFSKIGWVSPKNVLQKALSKLNCQHQYKQINLFCLDLIKTALQQKQAGLQDVIASYIENLFALIHSKYSDLRQELLEVLISIVDIASAKDAFIKELTVIPVLFSLMYSSMSQRSRRSAGAILLKLSNMQSCREKLREFQGGLIALATSDQNIGKVAVDLLFSLQGKK